jgi:hypothetical protein
LIVKCIEATASFLIIQLILMLGFSLAFFWRHVDIVNDDDYPNWWAKFIGVYYIAFGDFANTSMY